MKKLYVMMMLSLTAVGLLIAQTEADFPGIMKAVAKANKSVKANIAAKMVAETKADAKVLEDSFKQVETYFKGKGVADATAAAKANREAAAGISTAAGAGNWDQAGTHAATIAGSCNGCHAAHREGEKGGPYKIK
jgi:hypothetical protein